MPTLGEVEIARAYDAMIADYLLDPGDRQHNLEALARQHLQYQMQSIEELIGSGRKQITMARSLGCRP